MFVPPSFSLVLRQERERWGAWIPDGPLSSGRWILDPEFPDWRHAAAEAAQTVRVNIGRTEGNAVAELAFRAGGDAGPSVALPPSAASSAADTGYPIEFSGRTSSRSSSTTTSSSSSGPSWAKTRGTAGCRSTCSRRWTTSFRRRIRRGKTRRERWWPGSRRIRTAAACRSWSSSSASTPRAHGGPGGWPAVIVSGVAADLPRNDGRVLVIGFASSYRPCTRDVRVRAVPSPARDRIDVAVDRATRSSW